MVSNAVFILGKLIEKMPAKITATETFVDKMPTGYNRNLGKYVFLLGNVIRIMPPKCHQQT
jgi:hypothetical protein